MIESDPSSKKRAPVLKLAGTLLALALLVYLLYRQGWDEIGAAVQQITVWRFLLAFGLTLLSRLCVSGRWHVLLRSAGVEVTAGQSIRMTFAGLFASNFLPTTVGGDVIRLGGALRLRLDQAACLASLVVDRLVGMAGMAMALPFGLPGLIKSTSLGSGALTTHAGLFAVRGFLQSRGWQRLWEKGERALRRVLQALSLWMGRPRSLLAALAFSWGHMLCLFASLWLLLEGMREPVPFWLIGGLWSIAYFVTLLPVSINGLGVQELSLTFLFATVAGVSDPSSLTLALSIRVLQMFASLPGALFIPEMVAGREVALE